MDFIKLNCKFCNHLNENLDYPQDFYLYVYVRDLSSNSLMESNYIMYEEPSFDCFKCKKRNVTDLPFKGLVIVHENDQVLNFTKSQR